MSALLARAFGVVTLGLVCAVISCGAPSTDESSDAGLARTTQALSATDAAITTDSATSADSPFSAEAFRKAAGCHDCEVLNSARLTLPQTNVLAASAKLRTPDGRFRTLTLDETGKQLDEAAVIADERAAFVKKYGKLRPELFDWLAKAGADEARWVWIRTRISADFGRREDRDTPAGVAVREELKRKLDDATRPVREWLSRRAPDAPVGDSGGPIIRVLLNPEQIRDLAVLGVVEELGTDDYPGRRAGAPWSAYSQWGKTLRLSDAHLLGTGDGANVCVKEDARPDDASHLPRIISYANPASTLISSHARVTTGLISNDQTSPYTSVAPLARIFSANWGTNNVSSVDSYCQWSGVRTLSYSHFVTGDAPGPLGGTDMQHDWLAKASPYILVVASAGNIGFDGNAYVRNRGFSGLVVGGIEDQNTGDRTDDKFDTASAWGNPTTPHNDYELPHVAAPSNGADSVGASLYGNSGSTAMVSGVAALIDGRGPDLLSWPEAKRAVILATATGRADQGILNHLPAGDAKIGAGVVDAYQAADLAGSANAVSSFGSQTRAKGRLGMSVSFNSDFDTSGYLTRTWRTHADFTGRLRVAIAWDSTVSGNTDVSDADFDLHLYKKLPGDTGYAVSGTFMCASSTWDSTWELCDIPVNAGDEYLIAIQKYTTNGNATYLGLAWYHYQQPSGAPCTSGAECASGSCSAGRCGCANDANCPDRFCSTTGQCTTLGTLTLGTACTASPQCASGNCVDGVCCDTACGGPCEACTLAKKGSGADGTCSFIADGTDPKGRCAPQRCEAGMLTYAQRCNGAGDCRSAGDYNCKGYACSASACLTSCASDTWCAAGNWCTASLCREIWPSPKVSWSQLVDGSVRLDWTPADIGTTGYHVFVNSTDFPSTTTSKTLVGLTLDTPYTVRIEAVNAAGTVSNNGPTTVVKVAAVPALVAPPTTLIDKTAATDIVAATAFLYGDSSPVQKPQGTTPIAINAERAAVVHGVVRENALGDSCGVDTDCGDAPSKCLDFTSGGSTTKRCCAGASCGGVAGVRVTVVGHPEFGYTVTRSDGSYDLAVSGGSRLAVRFERAGSVPVQRGVDVPWKGWAHVPEVVLTALDGKVSTIEVTVSTTKWQVAESSVSHDGDGDRRATILFPPGVTATIPGSATPTTLHVRATELTVGANGVAAMPGELPPTTAYTYAVSLDADEAGTAGVQFSAPVTLYVDNFLREGSGRLLKAGSATPIGYYDPARALWVPEESGVVIDVVGRNADGTARVDVTGDGVADSPAQLASYGITSSELAVLGSRYSAATTAAPNSLMRHRIQHFSSWDINLGWEPDSSSIPPRYSVAPNDVANPCTISGSIIECENQVLGERLPITGTGLTLEYWSSRAASRVGNRTIKLDLKGKESRPSTLRRIIVEWAIAGQVSHQVLPASADTASFEWDGLDVFGRRLEGRQKLVARVGFAFPIAYTRTGRFGYSGGTTTITTVRNGGRRAPGAASSGGLRLSGLAPEYAGEVVLWTSTNTSLGTVSTQGDGLGGWNFGSQHLYDPASQTLFKGSGDRVAVDTVNDLWWSRVGTVAQVGGSQIAGVDVAPDGTVFFSCYKGGSTPSAGVCKIARQPDGSWQAPTAVSMSPAADVGALKLGPDGQIYYLSGNKLWRVSSGGGSPIVVMGNGGLADGNPARDVRLVAPVDFTFGPDGSAFILDPTGLARDESVYVRRIPPPSAGADYPDQKTEIFAQFPSGIGAPRLNAIAADRSGNVYVGGDRIYRIPASGGGGVTCAEDRCLGGQVCCKQRNPTCIDTPTAPCPAAYCTSSCASPAFFGGQSANVVQIAGTTVLASTGDGGPAKDAAVAVQAMAVDRDGNLLLAESAPYRSPIRVIGRDGIIRPIALTGWGSGPNKEGAAWTASWEPYEGKYGRIAVGPSGDMFMANFGNSPGWGIWRLAPKSRPVTLGGYTVLDPNGAFAYEFDSAGRHVRSIDATTNKEVLRFVRDGSSRITEIIDANGEHTFVQRPSSDRVVIVGPFGQRTELQLDTSGRLLSVANPAAEAWSMTWKAGTEGLLESLTDPRSKEHRFEWDSEGRLSKDSQPASTGEFIKLSRDATVGGQINVEDAGLHVTKHRVEYDVSPTIAERRTLTRPDGTSVQTSSAVSSATTTTSYPDGTVVKVTKLADPIFGLAAPLGSREETIPMLSGSLVRTLTHTAAVQPEGATFATMTQRDDFVVVTIKNPGGSEPANVSYTWTRRLTRNTDATFTVDLTSPEGRSARLMLDSLGRLKRTSSPDDSKLVASEMTYDRGRPSTLVHGSRTTSLFYRSLDGFLDRVEKNYPGWVTKLDELDSVGRVTKVTLPAETGSPSQVSMLFDANGNLRSLTPPGRTASHTFEYDDIDRPFKYTAPSVPGGGDLLTQWKYELDGSSKQKEPASPASADWRVEVAADTYGRTSTVTDHLSSTASIVTTFHYEPAGAKRLQSLDRTDSPSIVALYDGARPKGTQWLSGSTVLGSVEVTHDELFHVRKQTVTGGATSPSSAVDFTYDSDGLLKTATSLSKTLTIGRHPKSGQLTGLSLAYDSTTGLNEARDYNAYGETKSLTTTFTSSTGPKTLLSLDYEPTEGTTPYPRDLLGRVKRLTETELVGTTNSTRKYRYEYDLGGRLTDVYLDGVLAEHYEYGANGTRYSVTKGGTTTLATYDDQDRLMSFGPNISYAWTAAGRLASKTEVAGSTTTTTKYTYDGQSNLLGVTTEQGGGVTSRIDYIIDPLGRRVGRTKDGATTRWFYDGALRIVGELDSAGTLTQYVYGTHPNVPEYAVRAGELYRIVTDERGSLRLVVKLSDGSIQQRMHYDAFGNVDLAAGSPTAEFVAAGWKSVPFGFAGGLYDRDTKLMRFGAREYDPQTGRWTTKDPIGLAGGLNLYRYAAGDPINLLDITGAAPSDTDSVRESAEYGTLSLLGFQTFAFGTRDMGDGTLMMGKDETAAAGEALRRKGAMEIQCGVLDVAESAMMMVGGATVGARAIGALTSGALRGEVAAAERTVKHHIFPRRFQSFFRSNGIDIDKFASKIPEALHKQVHGGWWGGGWWNADWASWIETYGATAEPTDIMMQGFKMALQYGLGEYPIVPYF